MRFASSLFDRYRSELSTIDDFPTLEKWMEERQIEKLFLEYAASVDGLKPAPGEWARTSPYMMPQVKALAGRYSKLDEEAFYRFWIVVDKTVEEARKAHDLF